MPKRLSAIGLTFGKLKVIGEAEPVRNAAGLVTRRFVLCLCECGTKKAVAFASLRAGLQKSCGCTRQEVMDRTFLKHGQSRSGKLTRTYESWRGMHQRCRNRKKRSFKDYGGRGIKIDPRWNTFEGFYADMGDCPKGMSIGRLDNDGDYEKDNCEWQTATQQARNKRNTRKFTVRGITGCIAELCEHFNISVNVVRARIYGYNWPPDDAFLRKVRRNKRSQRTNPT